MEFGKPWFPPTGTYRIMTPNRDHIPKSWAPMVADQPDKAWSKAVKFLTRRRRWRKRDRTLKIGRGPMSASTKSGTNWAIRNSSVTCPEFLAPPTCRFTFKSYKDTVHIY